LSCQSNAFFDIAPFDFPRRHDEESNTSRIRRRSGQCQCLGCGRPRPIEVAETLEHLGQPGERFRTDVVRQTTEGDDRLEPLTRLRECATRLPESEEHVGRMGSVRRCDLQQTLDHRAKIVTLDANNNVITIADATTQY